MLRRTLLALPFAALFRPKIAPVDPVRFYSQETFRRLLLKTHFHASNYNMDVVVCNKKTIQWFRDSARDRYAA